MGTLSVGLLVLMALGVAVSSVLYRRATGSGFVPEASLGFYQVAYLAGGRARVAEVALAYLVWAGLVDVRSNTGSVALRAAPGAGVPLAPVEHALMVTIPAEGGRPARPMMAAREAAGWVESELDGLVIPARRAMTVAAPGVGVGVVSAMISGGVMLSVAEGTGLGFLPVIPIVAVVVVLTALPRRPRLTDSGRAVLAAERQRHDADLAIARIGVTSLPIESGLYIVSLYGREAMTGQLSPLARVLARA